MSESIPISAVRNFLGTTCPVCSKLKARNTAFCSGCYFQLPLEMRKALYKRIGEGFEEAYLNAKNYLESYL